MLNDIRPQRTTGQVTSIPKSDNGIRDNKPRRARRDPDAIDERYGTLGFWEDIKTGRWMLVPCKFESNLLYSPYLLPGHPF